MRSALSNVLANGLIVALACSASLACAKPRPAAERQITLEVNRRLDQRLHLTLHRLIERQAFQSAQSEDGSAGKLYSAR